LHIRIYCSIDLIDSIFVKGIDIFQINVPARQGDIINQGQQKSSQSTASAHIKVEPKEEQCLSDENPFLMLK
jgi:hypothetical protein